MKAMNVLKIVKWHLSTLKVFWKVLECIHTNSFPEKKKMFTEITIEKKEKRPTKTCGEIYSWIIGQVIPRIPPRKVWLTVPAVERMEEGVSLE